MADVYENAFFTIVAVSSSDSNMPFLVPRQPEERLDTIKMDCQTLIVEPGIVNTRLTSNAWSQEGSHGPLSARAWAWQERQLSVRIMQFTTTEVKRHYVTKIDANAQRSHPFLKAHPGKTIWTNTTAGTIL